MANNYFCIDIGEKFTKVASIKKSDNILNIESLGKIDTIPSFYNNELEKNIEDESEAIRKLLDSLKITKKNVNIIIPSSLTYSQILTMPHLNEKELISSIKYQADQFIPMPIEETNIDLEIIDEIKEENKLLILIVAAPKTLIEKIQNTIELAGLIPEAIENELSSSARFVNIFKNNLIPQNSTGILLANFGSNSTALSYLAPPHYLLKASHSFSIGYQLFLKEIQINMDVDTKKAQEMILTHDKKNDSTVPIQKIITPLLKEFISEIKKFSVDHKVSALYIFNEVFLFPSLPDLITADIGIPVGQLNSYVFSKKTPLVESFKNELALFASPFGGNLR